VLENGVVIGRISYRPVRRPIALAHFPDSKFAQDELRTAQAP
jgi:hypothetical protein